MQAYLQFGFRFLFQLADDAAYDHDALNCKNHQNQGYYKMKRFRNLTQC